ELHHRGLVADGVEASGPDHPWGFAPHEALDVLAPDEGDVVAEPQAVELGEPAPVAGLLVAHAREDLGRRGVPGAQPGGEIVVDPRVLLLGGDGQGEDLPFGEALEGACHEGLWADSD